jgi:hypothetical protein
MARPQRGRELASWGKKVFERDGGIPGPKAGGSRMKDKANRILVMALLLLGGVLSGILFSQATVGAVGHDPPSSGDASGEGRSSSDGARTLFVVDETVGIATTGDPFVLRANVSGTDDIVQVFVEYW